MLAMLRSLGLFIIAAIFEIGGAYLVWLWQRSAKPAVLALLGVAALFIYSLLQTTQTFNFGRVFAAYGGIFIVSAMLWGWLIDGHLPDRWDALGGVICLVGVAVILGAPRA